MSVPLPIVLLPSVKVTVPVGVLLLPDPALATTLAVKVTGCPNVLEVGEEARLTVDGGAPVTVCVNAAESGAAAEVASRRHS